MIGRKFSVCAVMVNRAVAFCLSHVAGYYVRKVSKENSAAFLMF